MGAALFGKGGLTVSAKVVDMPAKLRRFDSISPAMILECASVITDGALEIAALAKVNAPVDTGRLRSSIRPFLTSGGLAASVGTNVKYAAFVEYGTGPLGAATNLQDLPSGYVHGGAYFPPASKLQGWARRHKMPGGGYVVARAIANKLGTQAKPFLGTAFEEIKLKIVAGLKRAVSDGIKAGGVA